MCWTMPYVIWNNVFTVPDVTDSPGSSSAQMNI